MEKSPYASGWTYTREGYDEAYKMLTTNDRGKDYRKIIVFITDGETSRGMAPDAEFAKKYADAHIDVVAVGIAGYKLAELKVMAKEENIIEIANFNLMNTFTDKIFQKACAVAAYQNGTCTGSYKEKGLGTYFTCRPETCAFNVTINNDQCVNIYVSQSHPKPTASNNDQEFLGVTNFSKVMKFPEMENEQCQNQNPFHYSVEPCANNTQNTTSNWDIKPIYCGIDNVTASVEFTEYAIAPNQMRI